MQAISQEDHPCNVGAAATLVLMTVASVPRRGWNWWGLADLPLALNLWLCSKKDRDTC